MIYGIGQDLGSQQDPSALAVVSQELRPHPVRRGDKETHYQVWATKLWQLNTSYLVIGEDLCRTVKKPPLSHPFLAFDCTGNIAYWDILKSLQPACDLKPIWMTGGSTINEVEAGRINVGKVELLSAMVGIFAGGRLTIREQPLGDVLKRQIQSLTLRISRALNEKIDVPRDGSGHGDIAMAVAMALWIGERYPVWWDGSIGMAETHKSGASVITAAPRGMFVSEAWSGPMDTPEEERERWR